MIKGQNYREFGRKGGKSRSDAKVKAARENLKIATLPFSKDSVEGLECQCGGVFETDAELHEHRNNCIEKHEDD